MDIIERDFTKMMEKYPIGEKIIFSNSEFEKYDLSLAFHLKMGEYKIIKHGILSVGNLKWLNLYFDKDTYLQICFEEETVLGYSVFKTINRYFLKNSFDRGFWLGSREERGLMFYDDYFYCREIQNLFTEFIEDFCIKYFGGFDDFDSIEYELEDAFFRTNILKVLEEYGINKEQLDTALAEEIDNTDWIIDYTYDNEQLEIYYFFSKGDLEKRFDFIRNNTFLLKMIESGMAYDRKINSSFFQRNVDNHFCKKEYIGMSYDNDLSIIEISVGVPIDSCDFKRGE